MQCIHNCTGTILCTMNQCTYVFADRRSVRWTSGCRRCWGRLDSCQPSSQVQHRRPVSTQDHQAWTSRWQHTAGTWWAWHGHGLAQGQQWRGQTVSRYSGCWPAAAEQVRRRPQQGFPAATASNAISLDVRNKKTSNLKWLFSCSVRFCWLQLQNSVPVIWFFCGTWVNRVNPERFVACMRNPWSFLSSVIKICVTRKYLINPWLVSCSPRKSHMC